MISPAKSGGARARMMRATALSFDVRRLKLQRLHYFGIGDARPQDLDKLSELIKAAGWAVYLLPFR
jgi:hypothetical protein